VSDGGEAAAGVDLRRLRQIGIGISAVLVLIALVLATQGSDKGANANAIDASPHLVDVAGLTALEGSVGHPVYWAGERQGDQLEATEEANGNVYLRYLPPGTDAGDPRARFLTIGTYPVPDAVGALRRTAAKSGATLGRAAGGAAVLANPSSQGSVYLAYPGSDMQIEVYDPAPGRALRLIRSGAIRPAG
jgi:hypothetical protein